MKRILIVFLLIMYCSNVSAQEEQYQKSEEKSKQRFSIFGGGGIGSFANNNSKFESIYSERNTLPVYVVGIGDGTKYVTVKYRSFAVTGKSEMNFNAEGKAEWKQIFYSVGARLMKKDFPFYFEVSYVVSEAEEKISTNTVPVITELTTDWKIRTTGIGGAIGLIMNPGPFYIYGEVEYSSMINSGSNPSGKDVFQIGGSCLSAGILLVF
jgi:hypothetical protein